MEYNILLLLKHSLRPMSCFPTNFQPRDGMSSLKLPSLEDQMIPLGFRRGPSRAMEQTCIAV